MRWLVLTLALTFAPPALAEEESRRASDVVDVAPSEDAATCCDLALLKWHEDNEHSDLRIDRP